MRLSNIIHLLILPILLVKWAFIFPGCLPTVMASPSPVQTIHENENKHNQQLIHRSQENLRSPSIRHIINYQVADTVLVSDIEGGLAALNRQTGEILWSLEGDSPLVEISTNTSNINPDDENPDDDLEWVVEPYGPGTLYFFTRESGLTKIPSSINELVMSSPLSINNGERVFTGVRKTSLYSIDLKSGNIISKYGSGSCVFDNTCSSDEEEIDDRSTVTLGKTTFHLTIYSRSGTSWNITYSTWGPNNVDYDLVSQNKNSLDGITFAPFNDNSLLATYDDLKGKVKWRSTLNHTVINVFDVVDDYRLNENMGLEHFYVCLPHPLKRSSDEKGESTFLGITTGGSWYALGSKLYSLFVKSSFASKHSLSERWRAPHFLNSHEQLQEAMLGVHYVNDDDSSQTFGLIGYPQNTDMPSASSDFVPSVQTPGSNDLLQIVHPSDRSVNYIVTSSSPAIKNPDIHRSGDGFFDTIFGKFLFDCFYACSIGTLILLFVITIIYILRKLRLIPSVNEGLQVIGLQLKRVDNPVVIAHEAEYNQINQQLKGKLDTQDEKKELNEKEKVEISEETNETEDTPETANSETVSKEEVKDAPEKSVKIVEPAPEEKPSNDPNGTGFKKRKRGSRGGKKNKKKEVVDTTSTEQTEQDQETEVVQTISSSTTSSASTSAGGLTLFENKVLGYGSYGTVVYKGSFQNRDVAVKRMLMDFYDIANREISLLTESDDHPNVIRYFYSETHDKFLHIALELCSATLEDVIEKPMDHQDLLKLMNPVNVLEQIAKGLHHLHSLKIVHRDIKPQNILVAPPKRLKTKEETFSPVRILISDFGLCKKLESDESSFKATTQHAAGTSGWRAPELLLDNSFSQGLNSDHSFTTSSNSIVEPVVFDPFLNRKLTRAIDIFSLGCVFFYILSNGGHPFGDRYLREGHIIKNLHSLEALDFLPDNVEEAKDLISKMICYDPKQRPNTAQVLIHPFFWSKAKKLEFLLKVSDRFEVEIRDPPSELLQQLESVSQNVFGNDWCAQFDKSFLDNLGKYRKYHPDRLMDLLRALRNKYHHFNEIPPDLATKMSPLPDGFYDYFNRRFPKLLMEIYYVVEENLTDDHVLRAFF